MPVPWLFIPEFPNYTMFSFYVGTRALASCLSHFAMLQTYLGNR